MNKFLIIMRGTYENMSPELITAADASSAKEEFVKKYLISNGFTRKHNPFDDNFFDYGWIEIYQVVSERIEITVKNLKAPIDAIIEDEKRIKEEQEARALYEKLKKRFGE